MTQERTLTDLKRKLDELTVLLNAASTPAARERLTEDVRELERLVEIAANSEHPEHPDNDSGFPPQ